MWNLRRWFKIKTIYTKRNWNVRDRGFDPVFTSLWASGMKIKVYLMWSVISLYLPVYTLIWGLLYIKGQSCHDSRSTMSGTKSYTSKQTVNSQLLYPVTYGTQFLCLLHLLDYIQSYDSSVSLNTPFLPAPYYLPEQCGSRMNYLKFTIVNSGW